MSGVLGSERWTVLHGDCNDLLPGIGAVDAVVTDPPYGVGENAHRIASRTKLASTTDYGDFEWDAEPASPSAISATLSAAPKCIVWGGNYFNVPPARGWLVWDKQNSGNFADCELAWTNLKMSVRIFRHTWNGMIREGEWRGPRVHPTQKPRELMSWCMSHLRLAPNSLILDPFCGSGTTGVAAMIAGHRFIGIEREAQYVEIARRRIADAAAQGNLFGEAS